MGDNYVPISPLLLAILGLYKSGVNQGGGLSPLLLHKYIDDNLKQLIECEFSVALQC